MGHVTVPAAWLQLPCVVTAETNVTLAGSVSVRVVPTVAAKPLFWIWTVYVSVESMNTGVGEALAETARSACPVVSTSTVVRVELFETVGSAVVDVKSA